ncbi:uncharacterized protein LAESUDRAFT_760027 [Laetiporus sulphureus 93-53]|uniref:Uncharacterized protein n=1 Tax=Laetiporus sulphureus 93-53 TaxID=1314785 RepID=A0A165DX14_9APHY|nr:uncharacterized protein LAESUDRAFT_760027 [Laetiporus sulphureus 93-53]KZT05802.1 hypothetical protein LAESUDRAFT_760027 [Laetiporus sulphureus 93-53]
MSTIPYYAPRWDSHHKWGDRISVLVPAPVKTASKAFIDDVLCPKLNELSRVRAGACIYLAGTLLLERSWGLGHQSEVFDAEMFALAAAAAVTKNQST